VGARTYVAEVLTVAEQRIVARGAIEFMVVQAVPAAVAGVGIRANRVARISARKSHKLMIVETGSRAVAGVGVGAIRITRVAAGIPGE
jgi:hypothetical protein